MSARAIPFHCPYCGDTDLRPHELEPAAPVDPAAASVDRAQSRSPHGAWECRSCLRAFKLSMIGQLRPPASARRREDAR